MVGWIDEWWLRLLLGLAGSSVIGLAAYRMRALSVSGAISAIVMGTGYVTLGGPIWIALLVTFFVTSTGWSKWKRKHRAKANAEQKYEKSGQRDAGQVWANGGLGLLLCLLNACWGHELWLFAYIGVMASVNADTWATEIGSLSRSEPRSLMTGQAVEAGTSGGVTWLGSAAALAGAACIGLVAAIWFDTLHIIWLAAAAGFIGAYADSFLGATVQAMYRCPSCGTETERALHCGSATKPLRGWAFLNNDRVNMTASVIAGAAAAFIGGLI